MKKKTVKVVEMHQFLVCPCKSEDFAQSQENFAPLHDHETVTFRSSVPELDSGSRIHTKTYNDHSMAQGPEAVGGVPLHW